MLQKYVFRGVRPDHYDITEGGYWNLLQYYMGGITLIYYKIAMGGGGLWGPQSIT